MGKRINNESGLILLVALLAFALVVIVVFSIIFGAATFFQSSKYSVDSTQALNLAEAGVDKAVASLNQMADSYTGESEVSLGQGSYSVSVTSLNPGTKLVESTGYIPNKDNPKSKRTIKVQVSKGVGASFNYGIQVGDGGLEMNNSNTVSGSIYANGNIVANNSNNITGDAWIAGGTQPIADEQTDCIGANCTDYQFGKNVVGENRLDIAQSFQPSVSNILNKVSIKLKKVGNPPNAAVRILGNSAGIPNKNNILATGTLNASLVTTDYSFADVTFTSSPSLSANTTYWLMIDTSSDSSNYWFWQSDLLQSYTRGEAKWSPNWNAGSPTWNTIPADLSFKTYMGGVITSIEGNGTLTVGGNVHANTIKNLTISQKAYYQTIVNSQVSGSSCPNPNCFPGSSDPPPQTMPISDANITDWRNQAEAAGVLTAPDCNPATSWGPGKYTGNFTFGNSCSETIKTPIWITGTFNLNNSNRLTLSSDYGSSSGVIIVDGKSDFGNSNVLAGTGQAGSILMLLSTYDSRANGLTAVAFNNSGNNGFIYAQYGIVELGNSNSLKELTAWKIKLNNSSTISYETGLANVFFSSGPSGSFSVVKGTYQVK